MNGTLLIATVGFGVGLLLLLGVVKIIFHSDLTSILLYGYLCLFCLAAMLLERGGGSFIPMSFDSGGVTTGPITVPFIMALGVGIAMTVGGKNSAENSFGLIALCSIGPIAAVLILSMTPTSVPAYEVPNLSMESILSEGVFDIFLGSMSDVAQSLVWIVVFFFILQFACYRG